jgi:drug/metabolite transporter (DMT)-like permease
MNTLRGRILIAFAIVYVVWGSTYLGIRVAVETIPPFMLSATRSFVAGALLFAFARWRARGESRPLPSRAEWRGAWLMGFLMFVLGNALLSWAETRIDSGLAALVVGAIPLWVVLLQRFGPWGARKEVTLQKGLGVAVGLAGLGLLVWPSGSGHGGVRMDTLAIGLLMFGSMGWAVGTVIAPTLIQAKDKMENAAMSMLTGGVMVLIIALVRGERLVLGAISGRSFASWIYLVVLGSMLAYSAYVWLVAHVEAGKIATYALVNPIVAVFLGWLLVDEKVTARMLAATVIIIAGLTLTLFGSEMAAWTGNRVSRVTGQFRQAL